MHARWPAAYLCIAAGACFSPSPPFGAPCGPDFTCPTGQTCDIISNTCGAESEALVWRDDTAADFMAGNTADVTIEKQGFVGPIAFLSGGARATGYAGLLLPDASVPFETIAASSPTGVGVQRNLFVVYGQAAPAGLGLPGADNITVTLEGEIELDAAGTWRFRLTANDQGFFDIETAPGSGQFTRVVDDVDTGTIGSFEAATPGWYRYRGAFQDAVQFFDYRLQYDPPNVAGPGFNDIPVDRMRVRAGDLEGLIVDGFDNGFMLHHIATTLSSEPLTTVVLDNPFGMPIGIGSLSVRWNGQVLIEAGGDYTFQLTTDRGHRMWVDGTRVADKFTNAPSQSTTTEVIALEPGWHDVAIDVTRDGSAQTPGTVSITVASGPEAALVGGWFPRDRTRPISGRTARHLPDQNSGALEIPDGPPTPATPVTRFIDLDVPPDVTIVDVRAAIEIDHDLASSVQLVIDPPGGGPQTVAAFGSMPDTEPTHFFYATPPTSGGGSWQFIATDNLTDTIIGNITLACVTAIYDGGPAPFPTTYRYESAVRDLGDVVAFERFAWLTRQAADPGAVVVRLRTCDSIEACATEAYVDVASGELPAVPVRQFAQYEAVFTGNGDVPTALDAVELRYFVRSP